MAGTRYNDGHCNAQLSHPHAKEVRFLLVVQIVGVNLDDGNDCARRFRSNQYLGLLPFAGTVVSNLLEAS